MARANNFFSDNPDLVFHYEQLDFSRLFELLSDSEKAASGASNAEEYAKTWREILATIGKVCGDQIAGNAEQVEKEDLHLENGEVKFPPTIKQNVQTLVELGVASLGVSPKFDGLGAPFVVETIANEIVCRACPSTGLNVCWFGPIAAIIDHYGNDDQKQRVIPRIASGEWSGCMALTEPDAGSDLAALTTYGVEGKNGRWKLYGSKRFISNGNGHVALVLAKNGKGKTGGLADLALFMCPRLRDDGSNNYSVTKIEDKPGLHGSATCELVFDGSECELMGKHDEGFKYMLELMNEARIGVAFQGLGLMQAVFELATDYANTRETWGRPIARHELIAEKLVDMEVELKALRSLSFRTAMTQSLLLTAERRLKTETDATKKAELEKEISRYKNRVRKWTPLIKWAVGEASYRYARTGLQILGGYGFTKEYRAEWWVRESLILSIYEGTSQIQALMCVKDTLKEVIRKPRSFIENALGLKLQAFRESDQLRKRLLKVRQITESGVSSLIFQLLQANVRATLSEAKSADLMRAIKIIRKDLVKFEDLRPAFLHAERICEMRAICSMAQSMVWDAEADDSRKWLAERFLDRALVRLSALREELALKPDYVYARVGDAPSVGAGSLIK